MSPPSRINTTRSMRNLPNCSRKKILITRLLCLWSIKSKRDSRKEEKKSPCSQKNKMRNTIGLTKRNKTLLLNLRNSKVNSNQRSWLKRQKLKKWLLTSTMFNQMRCQLWRPKLKQHRPKLKKDKVMTRDKLRLNTSTWSTRPKNVKRIFRQNMRNMFQKIKSLKFWWKNTTKDKQLSEVRCNWLIWRQVTLLRCKKLFKLK